MAAAPKTKIQCRIQSSSVVYLYVQVMPNKDLASGQQRSWFSNKGITNTSNVVDPIPGIRIGSGFTEVSGSGSGFTIRIQIGQINPQKQGFGSGSVSALIWVAGSGSAFKLRIRIRIQEGKNVLFWGLKARGVPRILPGGSPPPDLDLDPDPHQEFELYPDLDPHQNIADPQPWAQLSKDCCLIYNYV